MITGEKSTKAQVPLMELFLGTSLMKQFPSDRVFYQSQGVPAVHEIAKKILG